MNAKKVFQLTQRQLKKAIKKHLKGHGRTYESDQGYLYSPGTVPVLLVAHLDTVHKESPSIICMSDDGNVWMSPQGIGGDDRCGVYALLKVAEQHDVHLLFTEDEEIGCIGADLFTKAGLYPNVNFIIEVDRKGANDAVFYDCANQLFTDFVLSFGFEESYGSFSDISLIAPHLGVAAVNLSSGYHEPHTTHEYVVWSELNETIRRICEMVQTTCDKPFEYIEEKKYSRYYSGRYFDSGYHGFDSYGWDYPSLTHAKEVELSEFEGVLLEEDGVYYDEAPEGAFGIDRNGNVYELFLENWASMMPGLKAVNNNFDEIRFDPSKAETYNVY